MAAPSAIFSQGKDFSFEFGRELHRYGLPGESLGLILHPAVTAPITRKQMELVRNCDSFATLHESVIGLAPRLAVSSPENCQSFRSAVAKQCSEFLSGGWRSMLEANAAARVLIGFMEDGLVDPSCALQSALVDCMLTLYAARGPSQTSHGHAVARPASGHPSRRPASANKTVRSPQEPLRSWLEKTALLSSFIDAKLLDGEPSSNLSLVLLDELRRCLQDFTAQELVKVAPLLQKGVHLLGSIAFHHQEAALQVISEALQRQEQLEGATGSARSSLQALGLLPQAVPTSRPGRPRQTRLRPKTAQVTLLGRPRGNLLRLGTEDSWLAKTANRGAMCKG